MKPNSIPSAGTNAEQRTDVEDTNVSPFFAKPIVGSSTVKPNCIRHKKDVAGIADMEALAEMIGNLHYNTLKNLLYCLSKKIDNDAQKDYKGGRVKLATALQYSSMSIFESSLRIEKAWLISKPFMTENERK